MPDNASSDELRIDFTRGVSGYRLRLGDNRGHSLVRAAGITRNREAHVVDATAGLGRDAFVLAAAGSRVTLIERSPDVHRMLEDGLRRASLAGGEVAVIAARMTLMQGDARDLLPRLAGDVVVIDPMHPPRTKSALVKKEMRLLRQLVGSDPDTAELLQVALSTACDRVVLKWPPRSALPACNRKPSVEYPGKTISYHVYIQHAP